MAIDLKLIDKLLADYKNPEDIIGENGLLKPTSKRSVKNRLDVTTLATCVASLHIIPMVRKLFQHGCRLAGQMQGLRS